MSRPGRVDGRAVMFWIAVAAAVLGTIAGVSADRGAPAVPAPAASETSPLAPDAHFEAPPPETEDRYSIFSDQGIHAGVMAF
jgi:hypothetical protein